MPLCSHTLHKLTLCQQHDFPAGRTLQSTEAWTIFALIRRQKRPLPLQAQSPNIHYFETNGAFVTTTPTNSHSFDMFKFCSL